MSEAVDEGSLLRGQEPRLEWAREQVLLLANPTAWRGRGDEALEVVEGALRAAGVEPAVHRTRGPGDARERAARAEREGVGVLVPIGGDGTLHEALNGLCDAAPAGRPRAALGLIPVGTGNDYARMLGIPRRDPAAAAQVLLEGRTRRVDLGRLRGAGAGVETFCNNVGAAFLATANAAHEVHRYLPGRLSYSLGGFIEFLRYQAFPLLIHVDGRTLACEATGIQVSIGSFCGGGIDLAPDAHLDDGRLQVFVLRRQGKVRTVLEWPRVARGEKVGDVTILSGREVELERPDGRELLLHADGEVLRAPGRARVGIDPGALRVIYARR